MRISSSVASDARVRNQEKENRKPAKTATRKQQSRHQQEGEAQSLHRALWHGSASAMRRNDSGAPSQRRATRCTPYGAPTPWHRPRRDEVLRSTTAHRMLHTYTGRRMHCSVCDLTFSSSVLVTACGPRAERARRPEKETGGNKLLAVPRAFHDRRWWTRKTPCVCRHLPPAARCPDTATTHARAHTEAREGMLRPRTRPLHGPR